METTTKEEVWPRAAYVAIKARLENGVGRQAGWAKHFEHANEGSWEFAFYNFRTEAMIRVGLLSSDSIYGPKTRGGAASLQEPDSVRGGCLTVLLKGQGERDVYNALSVEGLDDLTDKLAFFLDAQYGLLLRDLAVWMEAACPAWSLTLEPDDEEDDGRAAGGLKGVTLRWHGRAMVGHIKGRNAIEVELYEQGTSANFDSDDFDPNLLQATAHTPAEVETVVKPLLLRVYSTYTTRP